MGNFVGFDYVVATIDRKNASIWEVAKAQSEEMKRKLVLFDWILGPSKAIYIYIYIYTFSLTFSCPLTCLVLSYGIVSCRDRHPSDQPNDE